MNIDNKDDISSSSISSISSIFQNGLTLKDNEQLKVISKELKDTINKITLIKQDNDNDKKNNNNSSNKDWTDVYNRLNKWEDIEELQHLKLQKEDDLKSIEDRIAAPMGHYHDHSEERKIFNLPENEKLLFCEKFRILGNYLYSEGIYPKAAEQYQLCISYYEYCFPDNDAEQLRLDELRHICLCNISLCYYHMNYYRESVDSVTRVLNENPNHAKAYYRRAVSYRALDLYEEASKDLKRAAELSPGDAAIAKEIVLLKLKKEKSLKMEQAMAMEMLSNKLKTGEKSSNQNHDTDNNNPYEKTSIPIEINISLNPYH
jgi:tetratricopeptide (TPR) repeat protein